jgi:predicted hotdog family 3-hydroxylacyl-ACP dehydratase
MRVWRLTTGSTFIRSGTEQERTANQTHEQTRKISWIDNTKSFVLFACFVGDHQRRIVRAPAMANYTAIDKAEIRTLIPHSDLMCLLDEVVQWDDRSIACVSSTHRDPANPLRREGRLSAVHAFEYGAQAAAVHGGLRARAAGTIAPPGYLAALRDGRLHVTRLDYIHLPLRILATRLYGEGANTVYEFILSAAAVLVAEGRVTIVERA